jgi:hypothetical protein
LVLRGDVVMGEQREGNPWEASVEDVLFMAHLYQMAHEITMALLHLRTLLSTGPGSQEDSVETLLPVFTFARGRLTDLLDSCDAEGRWPSGPKSGVPWAFGPSEMHAWLQASAAVLGVMAARAVVRAVGQVWQRARALSSRLPSYGHYVNEDTWSATLAAKHLVKPQAYMDALAKEAAAVYRGTAEVAKLQRLLEVESLPETAQEQIKEASAIFTAAKGAVGVMTAASVVLVLKGEEQAKAARALQGRALPKALREQVLALAGSTGKAAKPGPSKAASGP